MRTGVRYFVASSALWVEVTYLLKYRKGAGFLEGFSYILQSEFRQDVLKLMFPDPLPHFCRPLGWGGIIDILNFKRL
jgi:hypothetical protein